MSGAATRLHGLRYLRTSLLPVFWLVVAFFILAPCACFLALAVSPRLFDQGTQWFTLSYLENAFTGATISALINSIMVSCAAAAMGLALGFPIAWVANRTTLPGRRLVAGGMWLVLLLPSWLPALGWVRLVEVDGVMYRVGLNLPFVTHAILGPFGVVLLLGLRCVPFAFLAITAALAGLGQEFEDAARTHGATRFQALRLVTPILAPAIWSALAIGFAESVSDFGVAATLAYKSHFTLATYQLYQAIDNFPPSFPTAAAMAWLLVASVALPLVLQARALRGRSYAVLSGRTRQVVRRELTRVGRTLAVVGVLLFFVVALGIPGFGAVSGSMLGDFGGSFSLTLVNYRQVFHDADLLAPLERSLEYGAIVASFTVVAGFVAARLLTRVRTRATRMLDFLLLACGSRAPERRFRRRLHPRLQPSDPLAHRSRPVPDNDAAADRVRGLESSHERPRARRPRVPAASVAARRRARSRRRPGSLLASRRAPARFPSRSSWPGCSASPACSSSCRSRSFSTHRRCRRFRWRSRTTSATTTSASAWRRRCSRSAPRSSSS